MSLHAAATATTAAQEHAHAQTNPYSAHPFSQSPLAFYPPPAAPLHPSALLPTSHLHSNSTNSPQNFSCRSQKEVFPAAQGALTQLPQEQLKMAPMQDFDASRCHSNNGFAKNQSEALKETQGQSAQVAASRVSSQRHLNSDAAQYHGNQGDPQSKLFLDQSDLLGHAPHDFPQKSTREPENLTKPGTSQSSDAAGTRRDEPAQISPVPGAHAQPPPRTPLEEPMVDGEKISPIASDRPGGPGGGGGLLPGQHLHEPPFNDLSLNKTPPAGDAETPQAASPSPSAQRPLEVTSTPIPPGRDGLGPALLGDPGPSALEKLKSLANRTDDLVLRGQGHGGQGQRSSSEKQGSYQDSECSTDSEDR